MLIMEPFRLISTRPSSVERPHMRKDDIVSCARRDDAVRVHKRPAQPLEAPRPQHPRGAIFVDNFPPRVLHQPHPASSVLAGGVHQWKVLGVGAVDLITAHPRTFDQGFPIGRA